MHYEEAMKTCIFRYLSGSHAYGMSTPESDEDYRGVFMSPMENAFKLFQSNWIGQGTLGQHLENALQFLREGNIDQAKERIKQALDPEQGDLSWGVETIKKPGADEEVHELRKFVKLAAQCNPNIIEFLFVKQGVTHCTPAWELMKENARLFLSKSAKWTFSCYAAAQLRRIEGHRNYLLHPPQKKPCRVDFGLDEQSKIDKKHHGHIMALPLEYVSAEQREMVRREKQYNTALDEWKAYQGWAAERNPKRKELEAKAGYDSKHASHLVRLIRMAYEILEYGEVIIFRPDRQELLDIRQCKWPYEKVLEHMAEMEAKIEVAYAKSTLPEKADHDKIAALYLEVAKKFYGPNYDASYTPSHMPL